MRGRIERQVTMFSLKTPEQRVPKDHPIRRIKQIADRELERLSPVFDQMYSADGRYSIPPETLLKSLPKIKSRRAKIDQEMKQMRARGFAVRRSPMTEGVTDISCPIRGFDGRVVAALTVPYLHVIDGSLPTSVDQARRLVEQVAHRISRTLGWAG